MLLKIPFFSNTTNFIEKWNSFDIDYCYHDTPLFSLITNCNYDLYKLEVFKNSQLHYLDYTFKNNFFKIFNNNITIKPSSHIVTKATTHYIPRLPPGPKIGDMYIPIAKQSSINIDYQGLDCLFKCHIEYPCNIENLIYLNKEPILKIYINKWHMNKMVLDEIHIKYKMVEWSKFEPIDNTNNKLENISISDILYIRWDLSNFIYIDDLLNNIDNQGIDNIYFILDV